MQSPRFTRTKEDFSCEHCGAQVSGTGYTNHCPRCLWSKHVDIHPGDRSESCGGMMKPTAIEGTAARYVIVHRCEACSKERKNAVAKNDDMEAVLNIAAADRA